MTFILCRLQEFKKLDESVIPARDVRIQLSQIESFEEFKNGGRITFLSGRQIYVEEKPQDMYYTFQDKT